VPAGASGEAHPAADGHGIHLPSPSFWPIVASVGFPVMGYGVLYSWWLIGAGATILVVALIGWALEPSVGE
jgi:cytochrome c oxidase subunit 1